MLLLLLLLWLNLVILMLLVLVVFDIMFNGANTIVMFNSVVNIYSVSILNIIGGMSLLLLVVLLLSIMVL